MPSIYGILGLEDEDRSFVNDVGQPIVYDAVRQLMGRYNQELAAAMSVFVERETEDFKIRYKLPGGGRMQKRRLLARPGAVKALGYWDVALPLEDYGDQLADSDVAMAYMRVNELQRHIDSIFIRDVNTVRFEVLRALFNNQQRPFLDDIHGTLAIEPLANGDGVLYPPVLGSEVEAQDSHYLASGYAATAISDTDNPYPVLVDELEEHFGSATGGENIVTFINPDEAPETEDLGDFDEVTQRFVTPGANTDTLYGLPSTLPGKTLGRVSGTWIQEWRWIPSGYLLALHLGEAKPLIRRVDPAGTGLPRGLTLVGRDQEWPLESAYYVHRYGFGVGNRLNGVVMQLTTGSYTVPAAYAA